jgi:hypothetical protein
VREQRGSAGAAAAVAAAARAPGKGGSRSVVWPIDEVLYQVPPPDDFVSSGRRPRQVRAAHILLQIGRHALPFAMINAEWDV